MIAGDGSESELPIRVGATVVTADGHAMGTICAQTPDRFAVARGRLFKRHCTLPRSAIDSYDPTGPGTISLKPKRAWGLA